MEILRRQTAGKVDPENAAAPKGLREARKQAPEVDENLNHVRRTWIELRLLEVSKELATLKASGLGMKHPTRRKLESELKTLMQWRDNPEKAPWEQIDPAPNPKDGPKKNSKIREEDQLGKVLARNDEVLVQQVERMMAQRNYVPVIEILQRVAAARPLKSGELFNLGFASAQLGRQEEAKKSRQEALDAGLPKDEAAKARGMLRGFEVDPASGRKELKSLQDRSSSKADAEAEWYNALPRRMGQIPAFESSLARLNAAREKLRLLEKDLEAERKREDSKDAGPGQSEQRIEELKRLIKEIEGEHRGR